MDRFLRFADVDPGERLPIASPVNLTTGATLHRVAPGTTDFSRLAFAVGFCKVK
jgi:hypothetical protein